MARRPPPHHHNLVTTSGACAIATFIDADVVVALAGVAHPGETPAPCASPLRGW